MASDRNTLGIICSLCEHLQMPIIDILTRAEGEGDDGYG
jgi:hypothetical protein